MKRWDGHFHESPFTSAYTPEAGPCALNRYLVPRQGGTVLYCHVQPSSHGAGDATAASGHVLLQFSPLLQHHTPSLFRTVPIRLDYGMISSPQTWYNVGLPCSALHPQPSTAIRALWNVLIPPPLRLSLPFLWNTSIRLSLQPPANSALVKVDRDLCITVSSDQFSDLHGPAGATDHLFLLEKLLPCVL